MGAKCKKARHTRDIPFIVDKETSRKEGANGEKGRKKDEERNREEEDEEGVAAEPGSSEVPAADLVGQLQIWFGSNI